MDSEHKNISIMDCVFVCLTTCCQRLGYEEYFFVLRLRQKSMLYSHCYVALFVLFSTCNNLSNSSFTGFINAGSSCSIEFADMIEAI